MRAWSNIAPVNTEALTPRVSSITDRLLYVDNLRWVIIILVVSMHAAVTYSGVGRWYYVDTAVLSTPVLLFFVLYQSYLQAFFMGLLFFLAGFFVPRSYDRKGPANFLRDRAARLGFPLIFYMLVLGPLTEYFVAHSWRPSKPSSFLIEWTKHIRNGEFLSGSGPLWFCAALLMFSTAYALTRTMAKKQPSPGVAGSFPTSYTVLCFTFCIVLTTFVVRLFQPSGSAFFNLQLANFPQYIAMFAAGTLASSKGWLQSLPARTAYRWFGATLLLGVPSFCLLAWAGGGLAGDLRVYSGGFYWQSAAANIWESFTCVGLSLGLLAFFRCHLNQQGQISKFLSVNAFSVYVFHPPVVIALARLLHPLAAPTVLKFFILTIASVLATYILSAMIFRRVPILREIL